MKTLFNSLLLPFNFKLWSCLLVLTFNYSALTIAQNLVPNPSFEDTVACPNGYMQTNKALGWIINVNSADYFHSCAPPPPPTSFSTPKNSFGYQIPATGDAYCGFYNYAKTLTGDVREYLGRRLSSPLIIGQKYYVSIKVSWADGWCASNKMGVLFSNKFYGDTTSWGIVISPPPFINNFAQVYTDNVITDSVNWTTIQGSFIADSAYQYIYIGNFFDIENIDTLWYMGGLPDCKSYYFIDDVCVSTDSATCFTNTSLKEKFDNSTNITVSPNPVIDHSQITIKESDEQTIIKLYNAQGKDITNSISIEKVNSSSFVLKRNKLPSGIYFIRIKTNNNLYNSKLIFF